MTPQTPNKAGEKKMTRTSPPKPNKSKRCTKNEYQTTLVTKWLPDRRKVKSIWEEKNKPKKKSYITMGDRIRALEKILTS